MQRSLLILVFVVLAGLSVSCEKKMSQNDETIPARELASVDLLQVSKNLSHQLGLNEVFNLQTCPHFLNEIYDAGLQLDPRTLNIQKTQEDWKEIYQNLWLIRFQLKSKIAEFYRASGNAENPELKSCTSAARNALRLSRYVEDYLAEFFGGEPQDFDQKKDFKPVIPTPFENQLPWTVKSPRHSSITLRSGDLIISRGNAYSSAAISRIVEVDSQFSHMAVIYVPKGSSKEYTLAEAMQGNDVLVLEAHIEVGSTIRPFREYAKDGNARNLLFRYTDSALAHAAAKSTHDFLEKRRTQLHRAAGLLRGHRSDVNYAVPYDFKMDLSNSNEVFCTEVGYYGYKKQGVSLPTFMSDINPKLDLVKRLGIVGTQIFAPGDMELEPQFELIAEFRNLRKLKGLRMKDMALTSFLAWMSEGYEIEPLPTKMAKSMTAWLLRQLDFKFVKKDLPKNMNIKILNTIFTLDNVNGYLESQLVASEKKFKEKNRGLLITYTYGLEVLEALRKKDRQAFLDGKSAPIHQEFRPPQLQAKPPFEQ